MRFLENIVIGLFKLINRFRAWHKLPKYLSVANLYAFRIVLRRHNLHDTDAPATPGESAIACPYAHSAIPLYSRVPSGDRNDLQYPRMGCARARFGRNVPRHLTKPDLKNLMHPDPRLISEKLLARQIVNTGDRESVRFIPAESLNLLAGAWIQFQVHDWFNHSQDMEGAPHELPMGDKWPGGVMKVRKTKPDAVRPGDPHGIPAYANEESHWWDASQVYGADADSTKRLRKLAPDGKTLLAELDLSFTIDGKRKPARAHCANADMPAQDDREREKAIDRAKLAGTMETESAREHKEEEDFLPLDEQGLPLTGFTNNWWLGIELLHTLFAKEHNAICARLRVESPQSTEDEIFETAHLINSALIAKIHTVEWTPAILGHPVIQVALDANWWGLFGEKITRALGRFGGKEDFFSGVPGSEPDHHAAPYALTEEFTSVYRLHPLIPEKVEFFRTYDGSRVGELPIADIAFEKARTPLRQFQIDYTDVLYSFGQNHPGAVVLHNYPSFLRGVEIPAHRVNETDFPKELMDVAAIDILRDRERGVPRYNEFRRQLHRGAVKDFEELVGAKDDPARKALAQEISDVYGGDIEMVDLMVGMFAEPVPEGFGFSDTAFRVFILMASRRLKSDRFLTSDFRPEVYTRFGIEWIQKNTMRDILIRHHPELRATLRESTNAFHPWKSVREEN